MGLKASTFALAPTIKRIFFDNMTKSKRCLKCVKSIYTGLDYCTTCWSTIGKTRLLLKHTSTDLEKDNFLKKCRREKQCKDCKKLIPNKKYSLCFSCFRLNKLRQADLSARLHIQTA